MAPSTGTVSTLRPRRSTVTRSATASTSGSLWEMNTIPAPSAASSRRMRKSSVASWAVSTAVGSSSTSTPAPWCSARRISTRCCWPTVRSSTRAPGSTARPKRSESSRTRASAAATSSSGPLCGSSASMMFSATVMTGMSMKCWCTIPMPSPIARRGESTRTASPRRRISPSSGWWSP